MDGVYFLCDLVQVAVVAEHVLPSGDSLLDVDGSLVKHAAEPEQVVCVARDLPVRVNASAFPVQGVGRPGRIAGQHRVGDERARRERYCPCAQCTSMEAGSAPAPASSHSRKNSIIGPTPSAFCDLCRHSRFRTLAHYARNCALPVNPS